MLVCGAHYQRFVRSHGSPSYEEARYDGCDVGISGYSIGRV